MWPERERLLFVGPGRAGLSLGYALSQADAVSGLTYVGRRPEPPAHPLFIQGTADYVHGLVPPSPGTHAVILSVPDDAIHDVALGLATLGEAPSDCAAFHLAGAVSTEALAPLHERGYSVGSLHPFQTMTNPVTGADLLRGAYFAVAGEPLARATALRLLEHLGSHHFEIPVTSRPLYHAAAVMAANYVSVLLEHARTMLVQAGVPREDAGPALGPLVRGAVESLSTPQGRPVLAGPVSRGDVETVRLHLRRLEPDQRRLYAAMGLAALDLTREHIQPATAEQLRDLFEAAR